MEQHETKIQDRLEEIHPIYDDPKLAGKHFITSVCPECGKTFRHWKRTTVYCDKNCQRRASRRQLKEANARCIEERAKNYQRQKLADEEFLSITKSSILLNISRSSVYRLIAKGTLHPLKITRRIVRLAVKELMTLSPAIEEIKTPKEELKSMAIKLMSKSEVLEKYHISSNWLITKLKRAGFKPTIIDGKAFYKPEEIKKTFSMPKYNNINSWYTVPEICEKENVTPAHVRDYVKTYNIPKKKVGKNILISQKDWDDLRELSEEEEEIYYTVPEIRKKYGLCRNMVYDIVREYIVPSMHKKNLLFVEKEAFDNIMNDKNL